MFYFWYFKLYYNHQYLDHFNQLGNEDMTVYSIYDTKNLIESAIWEII